MSKLANWLNPPAPPSPRRRLQGVVATRPVRRIATVLLSGATNLGLYRIGSLARTGSWHVSRTLSRFESLGWVEARLGTSMPEDGHRRRFYMLTPEGKDAAAYLAGLELPKTPAVRHDV